MFYRLKVVSAGLSIIGPHWDSIQARYEGNDAINVLRGYLDNPNRKTDDGNVAFLYGATKFVREAIGIAFCDAVRAKIPDAQAVYLDPYRLNGTPSTTIREILRVMLDALEPAVLVIGDVQRGWIMDNIGQWRVLDIIESRVRERKVTVVTSRYSFDQLDRNGKASSRWRDRMRELTMNEDYWLGRIDLVRAGLLTSRDRRVREAVS